MKNFIEYKMKTLHIKQAQMAKAFCIEPRMKMTRYEKWK